MGSFYEPSCFTNKFYSSKSGNNKSGLGLSIVKNIIAEHNAEIKVTSTEISTATSTEEYLEISVTDDGPGISEVSIEIIVISIKM